MTKNPPTSLAHSLFPNNLKFGTETRCIVLCRAYQAYQNLGQIDHNLQNRVCDDVVCKQPIGWMGVTQGATLRPRYLLSDHQEILPISLEQFLYKFIGLMGHYNYDVNMTSLCCLGGIIVI